MSSLSNPRVVTRHRSGARCPPGRHGQVPPMRGAVVMTRLAGSIDGVIGVDPHRDTLAAATTDPVGGLLAQTSVRADAAGYHRLFDFARAQVARPALLGGGGCRQLRRWAGSLPTGPPGAGGRDRPARATAAAHRRQDRRDRRRPRGQRSAHPRASARPAPSWGSGGAADAAGHPPQCVCGQGQRHQSAQGADREGA
jgi:hypothetical protein